MKKQIIIFLLGIFAAAFAVGVASALVGQYLRGSTPLFLSNSYLLIYFILAGVAYIAALADLRLIPVILVAIVKSFALLTMLMLLVARSLTNWLLRLTCRKLLLSKPVLILRLSRMIVVF